MIEELKQNIETELRMLTEISQFSQRLSTAPARERALLSRAIMALRSSMKIINASIPQMLANIIITQKLPGKNPFFQSSLKQVKFRSSEADIAVTLEERDRERFLKELSISEQVLKKLRQKPRGAEETFEEFKAARGYLKLSNRFFQETAMRLIAKGRFSSLSTELRRANLDILFSTYVAMVLFSTLLFFFASLVVTALLFFLDITFSAPYVSIVQTLSLMRLAKIFWIPIAVPLAVFVILYYYPSTEKSSIARKIDQELPFAVIHMSAIAGSGIEPTQIFNIIGLSREYPFLKKEIRKLLNQIHLYGYDLVTALRNVTDTTPSTKLAELFTGLSTTITSGGSFSDFFEKRSETLLTSYRIEREKYTKSAETFMDIYISLIIAAPMILMILLVIISVSQLNTNIAPREMTFLIIFIIGILNAVFLVLLHLKQPTY